MKNVRTIQTRDQQEGFSLIELMISMVITLVIVAMAFYLLGQSLNRKTRNEVQTAALADANQAFIIMSKEIANAGFGLNSNGLVAADCSEEKIRVRANLNALMKQTTSNAVTDQDEDIEFFLISNPNGDSALVRSDVAKAESAIIATRIDNSDINNDGDGDGLIFHYLDENGNSVSPPEAVRVKILIRIVLPQVGHHGAPGFQPEVTKQLSSSVVLRNSRLLSY